MREDSTDAGSEDETANVKSVGALKLKRDFGGMGNSAITD
jgi:hypothetical protein